MPYFYLLYFHISNNALFFPSKCVLSLTSSLLFIGNTIYFMPPSHCCEFCLRTNAIWHSLRSAQHRIDSNYFVLVASFVSPNVVSIRVSFCWFVSHRCTFVSIRCTFALGFATCLLRLSTLQYDAQRSHCRIGSHMFALVRVSSY